jgi:hypothetical protein
MNKDKPDIAKGMPPMFFQSQWNPRSGRLKEEV